MNIDLASPIPQTVDQTTTADGLLATGPPDRHVFRLCRFLWQFVPWSFYPWFDASHQWFTVGCLGAVGGFQSTSCPKKQEEAGRGWDICLSSAWLHCSFLLPLYVWSYLKRFYIMQTGWWLCGVTQEQWPLRWIISRAPDGSVSGWPASFQCASADLRKVCCYHLCPCYCARGRTGSIFISFALLRKCEPAEGSGWWKQSFLWDVNYRII